MYRVLVLAALFVVGHAVPQGVTIPIAPTGTAPPGCVPTHNGPFTISTLNLTGGLAGPEVFKDLEHDDDAHHSLLAVEPDVLSTDKNANITTLSGGLQYNQTGNCLLPAKGMLIANLNNGVMHDSLNRTAYIASNFQFQFDNPPQHGALTTAGYTVCKNGSVALGSSAIFWSCRSGNFSNLYDRYWAPQCRPILFNTTNVCH